MVTLFQQQRAKSVSGGLHPSPRLVIRQRVVQFDGPTQVVKRLLVVALVIGQFTKHHLFPDLEDVATGIVKQHPAFRHGVEGRIEFGLFLVGFFQPA